MRVAVVKGGRQTIRKRKGNREKATARGNEHSERGCNRDMDREQNSKWKKERSNFSKKFAIPIKKCLVAVNSK